MGDQNGKVAIVLGASTSGGMGEAIARRFKSEGATIVVSVVTVLVPRKIFGLTSIYSNVPQCPVIQVFQSTYHQPCSPLTTHS